MQINDCFKRENFKMKKDIRNLVKTVNVKLQCVKSVCIRSFSGSSFPAFGLNKDQKISEYGLYLGSTII